MPSEYRARRFEIAAAVLKRTASRHRQSIAAWCRGDAYDGEGLIVQSADGQKVRMMLLNPSVCVEIDHIDNLANWRSVIAWGRSRNCSAATRPRR